MERERWEEVRNPPIHDTYIEKLPVALQIYISHTIDIQLDGHCGFKKIATLIRYGEEGWSQALKKDKAPPLSSKPSKSGGGKQKKKVASFGKERQGIKERNAFTQTEQRQMKEDIEEDDKEEEEDDEEKEKDGEEKDNEEEEEDRE
ncbi:uncharacterized protein LOC130755302 [Actinidia eriantha]|uniref:uncharacterized protein LOC130755302 n=1 Tax=Actinidia eriantha TaxID=165200 RepID=UPI00258F99FA|nr:uncharacterized protein LOC130755302 [Actinidia eriantha]